MEELDSFDMMQEEHLWPTNPDDGADYSEPFPETEDDNYSDAEADADTLASAGMGTDEDYE